MSQKARVYINQYNSAHEHNMLPLAAGMLCSYAKAQPQLASRFEFEICLLRESVDEAVARFHDPAVIAFSCYLWNTEFSLQVARKAKERFPQALIIVGGPSVPRKLKQAKHFLLKHPFIDVAGCGEGEVTFGEVLAELHAGKNWSRVPGLTYRDATDPQLIRQSAARARVGDLSLLPSPFLDGTFDGLLEKYGNKITGAIWESNRGCPFSCSFCDWGQATQSKVSSFDDARIRKELEWISEKKIYYVFGADANFGIKRRDLDIAKFIGNLRQTTGYPAIFFINWTKNAFKKTAELASVLYDAGLTTIVTLSTQSNDEETLRINKRENIDLKTFRELKEEYNRRGIATYTDILLGLPGETYQSFCDGLIRSLSPYDADHISLNPVIMLPNAELSEDSFRESHSIQTRFVKGGMWRRILKEESIAELEEVVVGTSSLPYHDWRRAYIFGHMLVAFHDYKLLNGVINYLYFHKRINLQSLLEHIISHQHAKGSCFGQILSHLNRRLDAHDSGEQVVPVEGFEGRRWHANDAVFLIASSRADDFYREVYELTALYLAGQGISFQLLEDLFRFQAELLPGPDPFRCTQREFVFDWPLFFEQCRHGSLGEPINSQRQVEFSAPRGSEGRTAKEIAMLNLFESAYARGVQRLVKVVDPGQEPTLVS